MTEPRLATHGKQILLDGQHFADARDPLAAEAIVIALSYAAWPFEIPVEDRAKVKEVFG